MALSIGFRTGSFLPALLFKLRDLDFYPGGTFTHCSCQPSLDAHLSIQIQGPGALSTALLVVIAFIVLAIFSDDLLNVNVVLWLDPKERYRVLFLPYCVNAAEVSFLQFLVAGQREL